MEKIILKAIYRRVEEAAEAMERGDHKRAMILLRGILPSGYKHSFQKAA